MSEKGTSILVRVAKLLRLSISTFKQKLRIKYRTKQVYILDFDTLIDFGSKT